MSSTNAKNLSKLGEMWVKSAVRDMKKREKLQKKKTQKKKTQKKKTQKKRRKKRFTQKISDKKYKKLIKKKKIKKRLTKREKRLLKDTLFYKYCKCNLNFERKKQNGYGICMNSVYKNRGFKNPDTRKGNRCKDIFKK